MSIFFKSESLEPIVLEKLSTAFAADPKSVSTSGQVAAQLATEVVQRARGSFSWGRLAFAVCLVALLFAAAVYTGRDPALTQLYSALLHGFEVILGAVTGLLIGEAVAKG